MTKRSIDEIGDHDLDPKYSKFQSHTLLQDIPDEILISTLQYLTPVELLEFSRVCKQANHLVRDWNAWYKGILTL